MNCPCHEPEVFGHTSQSCALTTPPPMSYHPAGDHYPCSYCRDVITIRSAERQGAA